MNKKKNSSSKKKNIPPLLTTTKIQIEDTDDSIEALDEAMTESKESSVSSGPAKPPMSIFTKGLILILISSLVISFQNIITRVILSKKMVLGFWEIGGFVKPSMANSILILILRMAIVVPIMAFLVAPRIYNNTWSDIKGLFKAENKNKRFIVTGSGVLLFMSFFCMYLALGTVPTGVATTIFFIYPTITILLAWAIFKDKPNLSLVFAMISIYIGGFLAIPESAFSAKGESNMLIGAIAAALSGITFAGYVTTIKLAKMHPAPFSITVFTIILALGCVTWPLFPDFLNVDISNWDELLIGCVLLAATTLIGYLLNNYGVPIIGPSLASVISASGPAVTAIMALAMIDEKLNKYQVLGVFLVTLWVLGISLENMRKQKEAAAAQK